MIAKREMYRAVGGRMTYRLQRPRAAAEKSYHRQTHDSEINQEN